MSKIETISLGCRLNFYETERMKDLAIKNNFEPSVIINSCAVTKEASRQSRQALRRAKKQYPQHRILLTGCAVKTEKPFWDEADTIIENENKFSSTIFPKQAGFASQQRTRGLLKIQTGCDWSCTFCFITKARGAALSRNVEDLIDESNFLFSSGHCEITLTGVDITSYGKDLPEGLVLGQLLEKLLAATPNALKFRLSSLDPAAIDPALFSLLASEKRLQPFIHLSAQAGDDLILKRMARRHSRAQLLSFCAGLRNCREVSFGADLIAGFPTETEKMFQNSLELITDCNICFAHIFPFSPRAGTIAAKMPQVEPKTIQARAKKLREAAQNQLNRFLENQIGSQQNLMAETEYKGRSDFNATAIWLEKMARGKYHKMKITAHNGTQLIAAPL